MTRLPEALRGLPPRPPTPSQAAKGWTQDWDAHAGGAALGGRSRPPSAAQAAMGWTQARAARDGADWDAWRVSTPAVSWAQQPGVSDVIELDFTGGEVARAAREQARKEEAEGLRGSGGGGAGSSHRGERREPAPAVPLSARLNTGASIPLIGLGTWKSKPGEVRAAVVHALSNAGYRHIDCASVYNNEQEVGAALAEVWATTTLRREDVFIVSKLWNTDHAANKVEPAVRQSLKLLQLDYLDAYLMHWPVTGKPGPTVDPPIAETWAAMESLVRKGLVRSIGVSNFSTKKLTQLLATAALPVSIVQCEAHPYWRNDALVDFCAKRGIHFTAFSPMGSPDSADIFKRSAPPLLDDAAVRAAASEAGGDAGRALVKWALQARPGCSVLPKSVNTGRITGNAQVAGWALSDGAVAALSSRPVQARSVHGGVFLHPSGPYRTLADLWDDDE